jgi:hypothetical protein
MAGVGAPFMGPKGAGGDRSRERNGRRWWVFNGIGFWGEETGQCRFDAKVEWRQQNGSAPRVHLKKEEDGWAGSGSKDGVDHCVGRPGNANEFKNNS